MVETGGWGGIAHYAWNLCQALAQEGVDLVLFTNAQYELAALPCSFRAEWCFDAAVGYVRTAGALLRRLSILSPDVVHVQSLISTRFDALLWPFIRRRMPLIMTAHNVRGHENTPWASWTAWRCFRTADAVIVHTQESADTLTRGVSRGTRVRLIRHGDYAFFEAAERQDRKEARRLLDLPRDRKLVLAFGAIRPYKGILGLIAALPRIRVRHPDAHLVIVGPLLVGTQDEYREAIKKAGVEAGVTFRPQYVPHDRVGTYFAAADVAVYNYREVTDSGSLRIACSLNTPVVATAVGGFREFLTDGVTGRLVPSGASELLAEAISDVLADPPGAVKMAEAARALATSAWSWADSAKATLALYHELLGIRSSESPRLLSSQDGSEAPAPPIGTTKTHGT